MRLILFGGKGGVGKTTCAAASALALASAAPEKRFLLVSTDPAHSLADSLDGAEGPDNLTVIEFDAKAHLEAFKNDNADVFREMAKRGTFLDDEDINRFLDLSLPGLDELMAFLEIAGWVQGGDYAAIIVDTAPTGHTLRLLQMPDLARKWLAALDTLLAKHRYMKKVFSGRYQTDAVDDFVLGLSAKVDDFAGLLQDGRQCRFIPVAHADALSLFETRMLLAALERLEMVVDELIVNQWMPEEACAVCGHKRNRQIDAISAQAGGMSPHRLWAIPLLENEIRGVDALTGVWHQAVPLNPDQVRAAADSSFTSPGTAPSELPAADLLIFAGKGGVGKTTLACATAMALCRDRPHEQVLLFSTDPAHSLSACLDRPVGDRPTRIEENLFALEMDGPAEFEALKRQYADELAHFLENLAPNLDFTFDRQVMERIMDLAPTGIDEIMAVTRAVDLLETGDYHRIVLDAAPTGHLLRLLETPELIRQWLRVFFDLFIKYKRIFRLPEISQKMVAISKGIKHLQELLRDPDRSAVCAVAILTEMALAETKDLVTACRRLKADLPVLFVNQVTPESDCPMCEALNERESRVKKKFGDELGTVRQAIIYYQPEAVGLAALGNLGRRMYGDSGI